MIGFASNICGRDNAWLIALERQTQAGRVEVPT
jgi:hypothetical protein